MSDDRREAAMQALLDRTAVADVLYRYASTVDRKDYAALRAVFVDDARGRYGTRPWVEGADALVAWIAEQGEDKAWQHHLVTVYHVDVEGDMARALTYHTSHEARTAEPDRVREIGARYHDELRRTAEGWRIASKEMEVLWREDRP